MTMLIMMALLAGQPTSADGAFGRCIAAHRAMRSASIAVATEVRYKGLPNTDSRFTLAFVKPNHATLRMREGKNDRTYFIRPGSMVGYDANTNEVLRRDAPARGTLAERYVLLLGGLEDAVQLVLEPSVSEAMLAQYRTFPKWTMRRLAGVLRLEYRARGTVSIFDLDPSRFVLRRVRLEIPQGYMEWRYGYGPTPRTVGFATPKNAVSVAAFYVGAAAEYADAKAKSLAHASIKAYEDYRRGAFTVSRPEGDTHVVFDGRKARQKSGESEWAYDGKKLWVRDQRGRLFSGSTPLAQMLGSLGASGQSAEPFLRLKLYGRNPMRELLGPGMKVRLVGTIELRGVTCDILEITGEGLRLSAWIRRDNRLIAQLGTENRDPNGTLVSASEQSFTYSGPPKGAFKLEGRAAPLAAMRGS